MANGYNSAFVVPLADRPAEEPIRFDDFVRAQYAELVHFLCPRCRTEEDARDAAQESLTRLFRTYGHQSSDEWRPLLYRIAANVANDRLRQAHRHHVESHVPLEGLEIEDDQPNAEQEAERAEQAQALRDAVLALPTRCRQVFLLSRVRGMTCAQVASHCGISVRMVEKHLANAVAQLSRRFGQRPPDTF